MTTYPITPNRRRNRWLAQAGQVRFDYTFPLLAANELDVLIVRASGVQTLALNNDYTVSGVGLAAGGSIALVKPALNGDMIVIFGDAPLQRLTKFQQSGAFRSEVINEELDHLTILLQEQATEMSRTVRLNDADDGDLQLPPWGKMLGRFLLAGGTIADPKIVGGPMLILEDANGAPVFQYQLDLTIDNFTQTIAQFLQFRADQLVTNLSAQTKLLTEITQRETKDQALVQQITSTQASLAGALAQIVTVQQALTNVNVDSAFLQTLMGAFSRVTYGGQSALAGDLTKLLINTATGQTLAQKLTSVDTAANGATASAAQALQAANGVSATATTAVNSSNQAVANANAAYALATTAKASAETALSTANGTQASIINTARAGNLFTGIKQVVGPGGSSIELYADPNGEIVMGFKSAVNGILQRVLRITNAGAELNGAFVINDTIGYKSFKSGAAIQATKMTPILANNIWINENIAELINNSSFNPDVGDTVAIDAQFQFTMPQRPVFDTFALTLALDSRAVGGLWQGVSNSATQVLFWDKAVLSTGIYNAFVTARIFDNGLGLQSAFNGQPREYRLRCSTGQTWPIAGETFGPRVGGVFFAQILRKSN
jgi:hypothetical protein